MWKYLQNTVSQIVKARNLKFSENAYHPLCIKCHMSHFMCHMSCVTCHVSHVMCNMSLVLCPVKKYIKIYIYFLNMLFYVFFLNIIIELKNLLSCWASWWRVCHQQSYPVYFITIFPSNMKPLPWLLIWKVGSFQPCLSTYTLPLI